MLPALLLDLWPVWLILVAAVLLRLLAGEEPDNGVVHHQHRERRQAEPDAEDKPPEADGAARLELAA